MRVLAVYENEQVVWATAEHSPLLFNIVKGLADVAARCYGDVPHMVCIGENVISMHVEKPYTLFVVDRCAHGLEYVWGMVKKGDIEGVKGAKIFGDEK